MLGIQRPVRAIRGTSETATAEYPLNQPFAGHIIQLNQFLVSPAEASKCLWHELIHAKQDERLGRWGFNTRYAEEYHKAMENAPIHTPTVASKDKWLEHYYSNPFEAEARRGEDNHDKWLPLAHFHG